MPYNHIENCCLLHGCKYGSEDCPITTKTVKQPNICEICEFYGFSSLETFQEYVNIKDDLVTKNDEKTFNISEDLLRILIKL